MTATRKVRAALLFALLSPTLLRATAAPGPDAFGYTVAATSNLSFLQITNGSTRVLWFNDDTAVTNVNLGFTFNFYGTNYTNVSFNVNGLMTFGGASTAFSNVNFSTTSPAANLRSIAVLWDDWETQTVGSDGVYYKTSGTAPNRQFIVQWNRITPVNGTGTTPVIFEARLFEGSNQILLSYLQVTVSETAPAASLGVGATVGIRDVSGQANNHNLQWSYNQPAITNGLNLLFLPPAGQPPVINAASISPGAPTRTNNLLAQVTSATDPSGGSISYTYQWQLSTNNVTFASIPGQTSNTLNFTLTTAGNYYRVIITPANNQLTGPAFTTSAVQVLFDADGNGINDDWEVLYFGRIGVGASGDSDADGMSNFAEYLAGTNPTNSASSLRITSIAVAGNNVTVSWSTVGGKRYAVQTNSSPGGSFADLSPVIAIPGTGEGSTNYSYVKMPANAPILFHRIRLVP